MIGLIPFGWGTPGPDTTGSNVAWETGLTIGAAVLIGVGALLLAIGVARLMRMNARKNRGADDDFDPTGQNIKL